MVGRVRRPTGGRALMVLAVAIAMMGSGVSATIIVPADFSEMVAESQLVVHGRVVEVRAQMVGSFRTIESVVTIAVQEAIKGEPGDTVSMRVPGGQIGRYRRFMVGAPVFRPGEEVVIFLSGRAPAMPMPFGLSQGVYRVSRGADGRSLVAAPVLAEGRIVRGDPARRPIEVASFVQRVRAAMGSAR
jgi:hypothetical protein